MRWPTRRSSRACAPRRRRQAGTECFVWDNLRFEEPVVDVADPWITLAAMATATERIRLGPMVTPLARRRPVKVARETATLDRLSGGRLTLGVGLGSDGFASEYSITGEELDDRRRASMLDDSLEILAAAWSGETVHHRGKHYIVDGMRFLPRPDPATGRTGVGRGLLRQAEASAPGGAAAGLLPPRPGPRRTARRGRRRPVGAAEEGRPGPCGALRRRRRPPARRRSGALRRRREPPGGSSSSNGMRCRSTRSAL